MILEGLHEKEIFTGQYPFRLEFNTIEEFKYPLHWHNALELVYNAYGLCSLKVSGSDVTLDEGDFLLIPSGDIHEITSCSKSGKRYFIQFNLASLDGFGGISAVRPLMERMIKISKSINPELQNSVEKCIRELIFEYEKKDFAYALSLNARIFDFVVLVTRSMASEAGFSGVSDGSKKIAGLKQINKAFEYIEKNYPSGITLKDVSGAAGFSEYYFSRLFKEYTGQNFLYYLSSYRVKQAEKLLSGSEKPILDIALESGFNSLATFNRMFKRVKGCSPTFYRKACQ